MAGRFCSVPESLKRCFYCLYLILHLCLLLHMHLQFSLFYYHRWVDVCRNLAKEFFSKLRCHFGCLATCWPLWSRLNGMCIWLSITWTTDLQLPGRNSHSTVIPAYRELISRHLLVHVHFIFWFWKTCPAEGISCGVNGRIGNLLSWGNQQARSGSNDVLLAFSVRGRHFSCVMVRRFSRDSLYVKLSTL